VVLSVAWPWVVVGAVSMVTWAVMVPHLMTTMAAPPGGPAVPRAAVVAIMAISGVMVALIYVLLPGLYVWYYRKASVRQTLDAYDPGPAWTDACPTPVLGTSLWLAIGAVGLLSLLAYGVVPVLGTFVTGIEAVLLVLAGSAVMAIAAWLVYRVRPAGWWLAMAVAVLLPAMSAATFAVRGVDDFYRAAGFPPEQVERMKQLAPMSGPLMVVMPAVTVAAGVAYLLYVRRFFRPAARPL
jgi:hypothetical protein